MTRLVLYGLLAVVAAAAAVLSFSALDSLGRLCGFGDLSPLLPVVLDAGAAAGTLAWLAHTDRPRTFGRALALILLGLSVVGNATAHGLTAYHLTAPWWAVVAVSAVPPAVLGAVVHLATLAAQRRSGAAESPVDGLNGQGWAGDTPSEVEADPVAEMIANGVGRRKLARELGVSEHAARELLAGHRNGHGGAS